VQIPGISYAKYRVFARHAKKLGFSWLSKYFSPPLLNASRNEITLGEKQ
jgi:hypothetical protein